MFVFFFKNILAALLLINATFSQLMTLFLSDTKATASTTPLKTYLYFTSQFRSSYHKGLKHSFCTYFARPHFCAKLTKHFHVIQVYILPLSNIKRGSGGADTYIVGILYGYDFTFLAFYDTICPQF